MASRQMSRTPPPRQLLANETLQSLSHWKTKFKTFYKRDGMIAIKYLKTQYSVEPQSGEIQNLMLMPGMQLSFSEDRMDLGYLQHSFLTSVPLSKLGYIHLKSNSTISALSSNPHHDNAPPPGFCLHTSQRCNLDVLQILM